MIKVNNKKEKIIKFDLFIEELNLNQADDLS